MATYELSPRQELLYEDRATVWKPARAKNPTTAVVGDESYTLVDTDVPCYFTFNPSQDDVAEFGRYERDIILTLDLIHFPRDMDIDSDYIVKNQGMNDDGTPGANYGRYWKVRGGPRSFNSRSRRAVGKKMVLASVTEEVPPGVS